MILPPPTSTVSVGMRGRAGSLPLCVTTPVDAPPSAAADESVVAGSLPPHAVSASAPTATEAAKPEIRLIFNVPPRKGGRHALTGVVPASAPFNDARGCGDTTDTCPRVRQSSTSTCDIVTRMILHRTSHGARRHRSAGRRTRRPATPVAPLDAGSGRVALAHGRAVLLAAPRAARPTCED